MLPLPAAIDAMMSSPVEPISVSMNEMTVVVPRVPEKTTTSLPLLPESDSRKLTDMVLPPVAASVMNSVPLLAPVITSMPVTAMVVPIVDVVTTSRPALPISSSR
ncbi:MAG TPA: hypothetical protein VED40_00840 [Azospirillaceae bacterium]|nr:hypothetical protein [Azospirillaceae bacterium]